MSIAPDMSIDVIILGYARPARLYDAVRPIRRTNPTGERQS